MTVEQIAAVAGMGVVLLQGVSLWFTLRIKLDISNVKLWAEQRFVSKTDFLDTLHLWGRHGSESHKL